MNECKDTLFYKIVRPIGKFLCIVLYRPRIIGKENIPKEGRIILAGNHTNNLDCVILLSSTKRAIHFLAKAELFKGAFGWFFKSLGLIPVVRKTKDGKALPKSIEYLENEKVIGIFPEGTINRTDDVVMPFKIGAVKMAHDANSKIVPFVIKGKYKLFRRGISIEFLKPVKIKSDNLDKENEKLMKIIGNKLSEE